MPALFPAAAREGTLRDGSRYSVGAFTLSDLGTLEEIEKRCFSVPWSASAFSCSLSAPFTYGAAIRKICDGDGEEGEGEVIVGYCVFSHLLGEAEIENIAVSPDARRLGCADALLSCVLDFLRSEDCTVVFLEVRESNSPARALYDKFGFSPFGIRRGYYSNPSEDAVLMKKEM